MTVIWQDGSELKVDRPYTDEESKARFEEKCGEYIVELSDKGSAVIKCGVKSTENEEKLLGLVKIPDSLTHNRNEKKIVAEPKPRLRAYADEITGEVDKRIVQKVFRQHTGQLTVCYENEVVHQKDLNGRILINWTISPKGLVNKVEIMKSSLNNKNVEDCVRNSIEFWHFPAPNDGGFADVKYLLIFELAQI